MIQPTHQFVAAVTLSAALALSTVACAPGGQSTSATPAPVPTAVALATQVAPTAAALMPTVQASASLVAPTAQAMATQSAPALATAAAALPLAIEGGRLDVADSILSLRNTSSQTVDLAGHEIRVGNAAVPFPTSVQVQPGESLTIHTAGGTTENGHVYLGDAASVLLTQLRPGALVTIVGGTGQRAAEFTVSAL